MSEPSARHDIGAAHTSEVAETRVRDRARRLATFYRTLLADGVPEKLAEDLTLQFNDGAGSAYLPAKPPALWPEY